MQDSSSVDEHLITDMAICIIAAWLLAVGAQLARQPLVLAYLIAGFAVGPMGFGWIRHGSIETISEVGLILLLFMIGLEIDLKKVLSAGRLITITAASQILGCCALSWLFFFGFRSVLGCGSLEILYLAVAAAVSSTVIIVKILYYKRELNTLTGRLTLGVLVLQDVFAILFLALQPSLQQPEIGVLALSMGKVAVLVAAAFAVSRYALPPVFVAVARLPELVLVGALAWCFSVAGLASILGLSREMGALIAGVAISTYPYTLDVTAKVTSLRDFFVTLFFVSLGMAIPAPNGSMIAWALAVCGLVVATRFLTVFPVLHAMKQGHRVGIVTSLHLSQISEFSLVILALGLKSSHVTAKTAGMIAYAFVILAVLSSYGIAYSEAIAPKMGRWLSRLGLPDLDAFKASEEEQAIHPSIFMLGFFQSASSLLEEMAQRSPELLRHTAVVDFNPQVHSRLKARGIHAIYGDIGQRDTLLHAGIAQARVVVCSLPDTILKGTDNLRLLQQLREINASAQIVMHAEALTEVPKLYAAGASYVIVPRLIEGADLFDAVREGVQGHMGAKRAELDAKIALRNEVIS
jgi:Kef-type K+ transport system membrane component KefB